MESKHWLIVYDICNPKRIRKVEKIIESYAWRVQKSVFETSASEQTIFQLKRELEKVLILEDDFVLFFQICERDWQKQELFGINSVSKEQITDEDFVIL